jgi:hypothetical protein
MVTANVQDVASEFEDLVEERDIVGLAAISTLTAVGGALAQQISRFTFNTIGMAPRPSSTTGLAASGFLKVLIGAVHGFLALRVGGTPGLLLAVTGLGAAVVGGGDIINLALGQINSGTGSMSAPTGNAVATQARRAAGSAGNVTVQQTSTSSSSSRGRRDRSGAVTS